MPLLLDGFTAVTECLSTTYTPVLIGFLCSSEYNSGFTQGEHSHDPSGDVQKRTDSMKHKRSDATAAGLFLRSRATRGNLGGSQDSKNG